MANSKKNGKRNGNKFVVGSEVELDDGLSGIIRYIGKVKEINGKNKKGIFYGIELSEAKGKNNGYMNGRSYFITKPMHAIFVKLDNIKCIKYDYWTRIVIDYWIRTLFSNFNTFSINNISKIIISFGNEPPYTEHFDPSIKGNKLIFRDNNNTIYFVGWYSDEWNGNISAFGKFVATSGRKYHWKLKPNDSYIYIMIGITDINTNSVGSYWWDCKYGGCGYRTDSLKKDDIIEMVLDLRDSNNNTLSFIINGSYVDKTFDVKNDMKYKLGVRLSTRGGGRRGSVSLISFDVNY